MDLEAPTLSKAKQIYKELSSALDNEGLVVLRNANWSVEEADEFMVGFSIFRDWRVTNDNPTTPHWVYSENHKYATDIRGDLTTADNILVRWHAENTHLEFPQHGALWHMITKTCSPDAGQTGFVDAAELYNGLSEADQEFLKRCEWVMTPYIGDFNPGELANKVFMNQRGKKLIAFRHDGQIRPHFIKPVVQIHAPTGQQCIRFNFHYWEGYGPDRLGEGITSKIILVDGRIPTSSEEKRADELMLMLTRRIYNETTIQTWVKWQEGDLILTDLFRMIHAVRGGFTDGQRLFRGIWAFENSPFLPLHPGQVSDFSTLSNDMYFTTSG